MKSQPFRACVVSCVAGLLFLPALLMAGDGLSHARVVRLSYVEGTVALQRPGSTVWVNATVNTPIQEGFALSNSSGSFAEVEFENGSTARLGELSKINFTQLAINADGDKLNRLAVEEGYATFHFTPEHGDVYAVKVANTTLTPRGKAEFRTDAEQGQVQVKVFDGSVEVEGLAGTAKLSKNKILDYDTQSGQAYNIHEGIQKDDWDKWVEARDQQAVLAYRDSAVGRKTPLYGWSDLDAYGEWSYYPGYGNGWAPYAPAGWSPYSMGSWAWYPGFGWTWIGAEPWGWLPYHCGFWNFDAAFPASGWFWIVGPEGCYGSWSPALVTWFGGPGWIGWAPAGYPSTGYQGGGITAVASGTVQNGQPVNSRTRYPAPPHSPRPISGPAFPPSESVMQGGIAVPSNVLLPGLGHGANPRLAIGGVAGVPRATPAPHTVLMGIDSKAEQSQLPARQGFWGRTAHALGGSSGPRPIYVRMGPTLGGKAPAQGLGEPSRGISSGSDRMGAATGLGQRSSSSGHGSRGTGGSGPVVLSHGSAGGGGAAGRSSGGGISASSGGGRSSGGGGISSSSSSSVSSSSSSAGSSGGGGGHAGGGGGGGGHH